MLVKLWRAIALVMLCIVTPLFFVITLAILVDSGWPIFFRQKRMGLNKKPFWIWKFRTMIPGSERLQTKYRKLNEADGPVFKIRNDPRFTPFGKFLSWSGMDELPQLINVVMGDMSIVGPRPLPLPEAMKIEKHHQVRFQVLPGITSTWVVNGAHSLTYQEWMKLDSDYVSSKSLLVDLKIIGLTIVVLLRSIYHSMRASK